ncbi:MAG TPA: hypothetical protein VFI86_10595 [Burkholderiales bacterium]|nr:hypothetical protein [Burkholderiales bacterium]
MEDAQFSDDFCRFLQTTVPSVDAAELLLLLGRDAARGWSAAEIVAALRPAPLTEADVARTLEAFVARGLVAQGADRRVQYHPASDELAGHVRTLAQAYSERPVTLIRVIYALRDGKIRSFADAFKLRKG